MQPATSVNEAINIIKIMQKVCARLATEVGTELAPIFWREMHCWKKPRQAYAISSIRFFN